jgi:prophage DNA circulation protein
MSLSDKYQQASFRGLNFLIRSENEPGGKKYVAHEYPNSDRRFIEELGTKAGVYTMQAFVHGPDAITDKRSLRNAFKEIGLGVLVHPLYGRLNVKTTDWEFSSEETNIGEISFSVTFYESEENISLVPTVAGTSQVTGAATKARELGYDAISLTIVINKAQEALKTTQLIATTIMDVLTGKIKSLSDLDPAALSAFDRVLGSNTRGIFQAATSAEALGDSFESFYEALRAVTDPATQREMWKDLTSYEDDRVPGPRRRGQALPRHG